jgi:hypothetical protein
MKVRRDCEIQSSMRRGEQVPDGTATRVLDALAAALETEGATLELTLVAETAALEAALELEAALDGDGAAELGEPPAEAGHTNSTLLSCQVILVDEKPDQTIPVTALPFAPAKEVKGRVMVCVLPVKPVIWV